MFNQHLYSKFNSVATLQKLKNDTTTSFRLTQWRDSLGGGGPPFCLQNPPNDGQPWSEVKKLIHLPSKVSELTGLQNYLETKGNVVLPRTYHVKNDPKKFFYLIPRNVTITYGPYFYLGILDYRLERLHGLQTALKLAGANVHLRPVQHINHVSVWFLEKEIFTCKLTDLHHGGDGELDRLCYDAAMAFAQRCRKVLLHVRHKYKFDKEKNDNMFKECPRYYPPMSDEEEEQQGESQGAEIRGENEYPYFHHYGEEEGEGEGEGEGERSQNERSRPRIRRIYFHPLSHRHLMPRRPKQQHHKKVKTMEEEAQEVTEDVLLEETNEEYGGEADPVNNGPKGSQSLRANIQNRHDQLDVDWAYNRLRV